MKKRSLFILVFMLIISCRLWSQEKDSLYQVRGFLYDSVFHPVVSAHIVNLNRGNLDISDSLGIFSIKARKGDSLYISNLGFNDTVIAVRNPEMIYSLRLREKIHPIGEVKIFTWGSTYEDLKRAVIEMPHQQSLQEKLGLPQADPDAIPFYLDEKAIKSAAFAITSPVSFLYYNLNKQERSRRKIYRLKKNRKSIDDFNSVFNRQKVGELTGLKAEELEKFWFYLNSRFICNENCSEISILEEIMSHYRIWNENFRNTVSPAD